ncbi:hypothetical protein AAVH_08622 [Aphelenchoides avenae]|nr:hypothetical protein AAVH_08622 [Aphelenchus avenae]
MASSSKLPKDKQIKGVIGGPKAEVQKGKREIWYKVRWCESYQSATKIPPSEIKRYLEKQRSGEVVVLGPYLGGDDKDEKAKATKKPKSVRDMDFAIQMQDKIMVMSYSDVREQYKDELFEYFEKHASISDDDSA